MVFAEAPVQITEEIQPTVEVAAEPLPVVPNADTFFAAEVPPTKPLQATEPSKPAVEAKPKDAAVKKDSGPKDDEIVRVNLSKINLLNVYV